jgi:hypothetical protein
MVNWINEREVNCTYLWILQSGLYLLMDFLDLDQTCIDIYTYSLFGNPDTPEI